MTDLSCEGYVACQEAEDPEGKDEEEVSLDQGGMTPFLGREEDGRVHDGKIDDEACEKHALLNDTFGGIDQSINNLPRYVAA